MASNRSRELKRARKHVERRRAARESAARETRRQQELAAARRDVRNRRRRHAIAYGMFGLAAVMAVTHVFEHAGTISLMSQSYEDLLIGYPMAAMLALGGGIVYGT